MGLLRLLFAPRGLFAATGIAAAGLVCGGLILAHTLNLAACPLCILQRMACLALALAAGLGLVMGHTRTGRVFSALLMLASTLSGAGVAAYQTYIQRFAQDVQCSGEAAWWELLVDWAGEKSPLLFQASGLCSDPAWKFLGLSIAEWSLGWFTLFLLVALRALTRRR